MYSTIPLKLLISIILFKVREINPFGLRAHYGRIIKRLRARA